MAKRQYRNLNPEEKELLKIEYKELCQDWRMRDKYVLDKIPIISILFTLLGLAIAGISETSGDQDLITLPLALMGVFFALVMIISVFKDIYFRDGTRKLLQCLSDYMGTRVLLEELECQPEILSNLGFSRKIRVKVGDTSLKSLRIPGGFKEILSKQDTFKWIFCFYLAWFVIFLIMTAVIFYDWTDSLIWTLIFCYHLLVVVAIFLYRGASSKEGDKNSSPGGGVE